MHAVLNLYKYIYISDGKLRKKQGQSRQSGKKSEVLFSLVDSLLHARTYKETNMQLRLCTPCHYVANKCACLNSNLSFSGPPELLFSPEWSTPVCVCVSHPDSKGFHSLTIHCNCDTYHFLHSFSCSRGPAHDITTLANEASDVMGCGQRRLTVYLPRNCCSRCPIRSVCFHGLSCFLPQTRGFSCSSALQPTRSAPLVLCRLEKHFMLKHLQILGLFAMLFYRLPSQRAN